MRYVAMLRGVNLGGKTMVRMKDLKSMFEKLGFKNVTSYINSGNLAFDAAKTAENKLVEMIETAINSELGLSVQVMVRSQSDIHEVLRNNPFEGKYETHKQMHVLFMKDEIPRDKQEEVLGWQTDQEQIVISGREIYALLLGGVAESRIGRGLIERKLKKPMTARNWRTVEKIADL